MGNPETLTYERHGRIGRITLDRPERGNGITLEMPAELAAAVEEANLDPAVHVIALAGNGNGFCGGYDLGAAETFGAGPGGEPTGRPGADLGPGGRLPDDVAEPARLHVAVSFRQAGRLQGSRLLRCRRHRHGALLGSDRRRGPREDRLPAGPRLGRAH